MTTWSNALRRSIERNAPHPQFFQLSTIGLDGSPRCRTVVCRRISDAEIFICTSTESDKWRELQRDGRCELCWYFPESREQFRIKGYQTRFLLKPNDVDATEVWNGMTQTARDMFLKAGGPEPNAFGVLAFRASAVQVLDLTTGEITNWTI